MQAGILDREAFVIACGTLIRKLEARRKRFLMWWYVNLLLAFILFVTGICYPRECLQAIAGMLHRSNAVSVSESRAFSAFSMVTVAGLLILPIVRYRGGWGAVAPLQQQLWATVCSWLGDAHVALSATSLAHLARESGLFPTDAGISERAGIKGRILGATYSIQEMAVATVVEGREQCVFRGLFLVCQVPQKKHSGVLVPSAQRMLMLHGGYIMRDQLLLLGWPQVVDYELMLSQGKGVRCVLTHDVPEMSLPDEHAWERLQEQVIQMIALPSHGVAWDIRMWEWGGLLYNRFSERRERPMLPSEIEYARQRCAQPALLTARQVDESAFNGLPGVAFVKGGYRVAVPCQHHIFVSPSLFSSSMTPESMLVVYDSIMWMSVFVEKSQSLVD